MNIWCAHIILTINITSNVNKKLGTVIMTITDCNMQSSESNLCIINKMYHKYIHDHTQYEYIVYLH